jgi:hypothetical protein
MSEHTCGKTQEEHDALIEYCLQMQQIASDAGIGDKTPPLPPELTQDVEDYKARQRALAATS